MSTNRFNNFGELYRAAYAEPDPEIKQLLLADVKQALDRWADSVGEGPVPPARPRASQVSLPTITPIQQAA
jgi:hypothetical protein